MKAVHSRVALVSFLSSLLLVLWSEVSAAQQASAAQLQPGLVVEKVAKSSDAEKAGLSEGDVILRWRRGDSSGSVDSPLDLSKIEIEQLPLGEITLLGQSRGQDKSWVWTESKNYGVPEGAWGISTRPNLQAQLFSLYQEGRAAENGKVAEAVVSWQSAAAEVQAQRLPAWLQAWFWLQSAQALVAAKQWEQANVTCRQASQIGGASSLSIQVVTACGYMFFRARQEDLSEKYYRQALSAAQATNANGMTAASILIYLGRLASGREELDKAQELMNAALRIHEVQAPNTLILAQSCNRVGYMYQVRGELEQSERYFRISLSLREELAPDSDALAVGLQNLGDTLVLRGDLDKAEPYHLRALALWEKLRPDTSYVAGCLVDMSNGADDRGDVAKAEEYLRRALTIQRRLQPRGPGTAASLNNLGLILQERGQLAEAGDAFKEALAIKEERAPDSLDVSLTLGNIGALLRERGELDEAEKYLRRSLAIREKVAPKSGHLGIAYTELGDLALERQDLALAESYYRKALAVQEGTAPASRQAADVFHRLGDTAMKKGDSAEAEENYLQALDIRGKLSRNSADYAETLMALAEVARVQKQRDVAGQRFQQALDALEGQTARLGGTEGIRAGFRARYENYYKGYVELLIAQQKPELALGVLERSRARALLETLAAARVDIRKGVDSALLSQERKLQADIGAKSDRRIRLLSDKHSDEQIAAIDNDLKNLLGQYTEVEGQIRTNSPAYAALTQPQPLTTAEVQQLLDADTLLLEYTLGEQHSYVFAVTPDAIAAHELPPRAEIEPLARSVHDALTARNQAIKGETPAQRQARWEKADGSYASLSAELSRMVLAPVAADIRGKRLLVVGDGALQYIPFAALPDPAHGSPSPVPLIAGHEVVSLPSASVLAILRQQEHDRKPAPKAVAVLADPVFSARDGRLTARAGQRRPKPAPAATGLGSADELLNRSSLTNSSPDRTSVSSYARPANATDELLTRSVRDVGLELSRLPFTRREAEAIMSLTPPGQGMEALDFQATRATAASPELAQYRIVHFATHGLLDSQHPELSGLVLSLVDRQGKPQSGFLALEDIYNLTLPADLVVLSACDTGLGKEISGEGLIGLTRGFMYAGANRVVASLWSINDVATSELMGRFYRGILRDQLSASSALRQAQVEMWKHARWKSPYYWAAFQIQGDWK